MWIKHQTKTRSCGLKLFHVFLLLNSFIPFLCKHKEAHDSTVLFFSAETMAASIIWLVSRSAPFWIPHCSLALWFPSLSVCSRPDISLKISVSGCRTCAGGWRSDSAESSPPTLPESPTCGASVFFNSSWNRKQPDSLPVHHPHVRIHSHASEPLSDEVFYMVTGKLWIPWRVWWDLKMIACPQIHTLMMMDNSLKTELTVSVASSLTVETRRLTNEHMQVYANYINMDK